MGTEEKAKNIRKKRITICMGVLLVLGVTCLILGILVYLLFHNLVADMIKKELPLRHGGQVTDVWMNPPAKPLLRVYFFNTTNPAGFLKGEKPFLVEMGPYTWEETWSKEGVEFAEDGSTVKYNIKKTYRFRRDLSIGGEDDTVTVPNIPLFASVNQMRWAGKLVQQALSSMLGILKQEVFNSTTVGDIMWGYDHPLIKLGNDVLPPEEKLPFNKFGFFIDKNNSLEGVYEVKTGQNDVYEIGQMVKFQDKTELDFWSTEECNTMRGTDGTIFHPDLNRNETLYIFNMNLCQSLPLVYQQDVQHHGINTYRFVPPADVFGTPEENPRNECFCSDSGQCAPSGLFNISKCQFGSPLMLSWPHFFQADPKLLDDVEGLEPRQERHQFHIDILPAMGVGMRASVTTQINLVMQETEHVQQLEGIRDIIFPVLWFQDGLDELSDEETVSLLKMAVHAPETARSIMYPSLFVIGSFMILAVAAFLVRKVVRSNNNVADSNTTPTNGSTKSGSDPLKNGLTIPRPRAGSTTPPPDYDDAA